MFREFSKRGSSARNEDGHGSCGGKKRNDENGKLKKEEP